MLQHANLMVSARDQGRMVGFARALTDFCYCCYLSDLAVDRDYQQRGIGRELLYTMQHKLGDEVMVCLLSAPEAMPFYPNAGFQQAGQAWWIPRKR
jgi:ribosomal protein S18 acetylase RimI-like enzyme